MEKQETKQKDFFIACRRRDVLAVWNILQEDLVDVNGNVETKKGATVLHLACRMNSHCLASTLMRCGANIEAKNHHHEKALSLAIRRTNVEMVKLLTTSEAKLHDLNMHNQSALEIILLEKQRLENSVFIRKNIKQKKQHPV